MSATEFATRHDRGPAVYSGLEPPIRESRFWMVQGLVAGITVVHGLIEMAERDEELTGFLDGVRHLPVFAYVVPVLLAGLWYGMRGGLLTGAVTIVLSIPNLVMFHRDDFAWLGEALANAIVITVGFVVALVVERNIRLRTQAEAHSRRLRTLWDVAGTLGRRETEDGIVDDVLERLTRSGTVDAAAFSSHGSDGPKRILASGEARAVRTVREALQHLGDPGAGRRSDPSNGVLHFEVSTGHLSFGTLSVSCPDGRACADDSNMLSLIAKEMAAVLENLAHREDERLSLQRYARAVTVAQEHERKRIARELHDGPAQAMVQLSRGLDHVTEALGKGHAELETTQELRELVQSTLASLRRTTQALRPPVLDDLGLAAALRSLCERRTKRGKLTVGFEVIGEERRLDQDAELAAYRIAQEALTNVERHAETDHALVHLEFLPEKCVMTVTDAGKGIGPAPIPGDHFGIVGMRERAELAGSKFEIETAPSSGTKIRLVLAGSSVGGRT